MATREEEHLGGTCSLLLTTFIVYKPICKEGVKRFLLSRCISIVLAPLRSGVYLEAFKFSIDSGGQMGKWWTSCFSCCFVASLFGPGRSPTKSG